MLGFVVAAAAFHAVRALPRNAPSPVLSARQEVITHASGITETVQHEKTGPNTAVTIGATAAIIVGFIALILLGIWVGSWRRKKNVEWRRSIAEAQQQTKNLNRLTMKGQRPGSVPTTPTSSIGSSSKMDRKSSALSLTSSTASSFASSGIDATPPHEQRRQTVLHQPTPRTPSILVQSSLLHQHSEYPPPPPSNDRPETLSSIPPGRTRNSFYAQQPSRPSPLHNSVTLPPSEDSPTLHPSEDPHNLQPQPSFEPPSRHSRVEGDPAAPPSSRSPPSFQPPSNRKSRGDMDLTIVIPPSQHQVPHVSPGLENDGDASANSMNAQMGKAL
ncbi:hypothetical protein FS837_005573 [Tulasnella sp. UAMH 9824]|nr:hypothetical protein FS837_005573 [Tulasnella sp. UAMH 9824]